MIQAQWECSIYWHQHPIKRQHPLLITATPITPYMLYFLFEMF